jgi:hypothetical protein
MTASPGIWIIRSRPLINSAFLKVRESVEENVFGLFFKAAENEPVSARP